VFGWKWTLPLVVGAVLLAIVAIVSAVLLSALIFVATGHRVLGIDARSAPAVVAAVTALDTLTLAIVAGWSLFETRRMAAASGVMAKASEALVQETVRGRELGWRPYLTIAEAFEQVSIAGTPWDWTYAITNIGRGPALRCRVAMRLPASATDPSPSVRNPIRCDIGAGSTESLELEACDGVEETRYLYDSLPAEGFAWEERIPVCVCEDQFGGLYLFQAGRVPGYWHPSSQVPRPAWTQYREKD
jgi:hypothetical protein